MAEALCPACGSLIASEDINVSADSALCRICGFSTSYSAIIHAPAHSIRSCPPEGCACSREDGRWRAIAFHRRPEAVVVILFALVWNCVVGAAFSCALVSPKSPNPCFLVFHVSMGVYVLGAGLAMGFGDTELMIHDGVLTASMGISKLRWRRQCDTATVSGLRTETTGGKSRMTRVVVGGQTEIRFGGLLNDERRNYLHAVLAAELHAERVAAHKDKTGTGAHEPCERGA